MISIPRTVAACASAAIALVFSMNAGAQSSSWSGGGSYVHGHVQPKETIWNFTLETRFGAYYPAIDETFAADPAYPCGGPYHCFFGNGAQFYFGLELDWLPVRIPYVGKVGPAFGWGVVMMNAKTHDAKSINWSENWSEQGASTSESTGITLFPMHVSAVLRVDEISRRTVLPIVPYGKIGFGFGTWNSGTSQGTSKIGDDSKTTAEGTSFGPHIALGGMFGLNWLDRRSGTMARETTGIDHAYLFGEWMYNKLDYGFGKDGMHIGTSSWVVGIALDL